MNSNKLIIQLSADEARDFLLKSDSYCTIPFPNYIDFSNLLNKTYKDFSKIYNKQSPKNVKSFAIPDNMQFYNYQILANKANATWRPLEIIHPFFYCWLIYELTKPSNWNTLTTIINNYRSRVNPIINCASIPVVSLSKLSDKAEQVKKWFTQVEQYSLAVGLKYKYIHHTDITNCYGSIYTHCIAWAIHGETEAKSKTNDSSLLGNKIDEIIRKSRANQTNGIFQGSVVADLIAEIVLAYIDSKLYDAIIEEYSKLIDIQIIRYRDDYRIFSNDETISKRIIQLLSKVLIPFGMQLNSAKTKLNDDIVLGSIKKDKIDELECFFEQKWLQKQLLMIYSFSRKHQNSGRLSKLLTEFYDVIADINQLTDKPESINRDTIEPMITMTARLAVYNPMCSYLCLGIINKLLNFIQNADTKIEKYKQIRDLLLSLPHNTIIGVWLQRVSYKLKSTNTIDLNNNEITKLLDGKIKNDSLWDLSWINCAQIVKTIKETSIIDHDKLEKIPEVISKEEMELFAIQSSDDY